MKNETPNTVKAHIYKDWYIGADEYQWILYRKETVQKGKTKGNVRYAQHGYYISLAGMIDFIIRKELIASDMVIMSLDQLRAFIELEFSDLANKFSEAVKREKKG